MSIVCIRIIKMIEFRFFVFAISKNSRNFFSESNVEFHPDRNMIIQSSTLIYIYVVKHRSEVSNSGVKESTINCDAYTSLDKSSRLRDTR